MKKKKELIVVGIFFGILILVAGVLLMRVDKSSESSRSSLPTFADVKVQRNKVEEFWKFSIYEEGTLDFEKRYMNGCQYGIKTLETEMIALQKEIKYWDNYYLHLENIMAEDSLPRKLPLPDYAAWHKELDLFYADLKNIRNVMWMFDDKGPHTIKSSEQFIHDITWIDLFIYDTDKKDAFDKLNPDYHNIKSD